MEEDGEEETPGSPFWLQTTTNVSRMQRYRHLLSSLFFNLIIFLLFLAILSILFVIPNAIDFSSSILKPNLVKKSWDSINLVLVLVALAFGFLSRNINIDEKLRYDRSDPELSPGAPIMSPSSSTPHQWYDFQDQSMSSSIGLRRQKASSSYPDLRELSPPWDHGGEPWRFSDDTHFNYYKVLESDRNYIRQRSRRDQYSGNTTPVSSRREQYSGNTAPVSSRREQYSGNTPLVSSRREQYYENTPLVNSIGGATEESLYASPHQTAEAEKGLYFSPPDTTPPPSLPPQPPTHTVKKKIKRRARSSEPRKVLSPVIEPEPEPSSPPPVKPLSDRKTNGANATKEFFSSFYHKKKKKRQKERSFDDLQGLLRHSQPPAVKVHLPPASPPPLPPPPPPPAPSVLHKLFAIKKEKRKNITFATDKPRVPLMLGNLNSIDDSSSGGDSPMKQLPPPPPPLPPFKVPDWEFAVEGDFVSLQSGVTSRSVSPTGDEAQSPAVGVASPLFCPSPDVDTKADNFIESFRARLKLERMSKLGPGPDSGPGES